MITTVTRPPGAPERPSPRRPAWRPPAKYQVRRVLGTGGSGTVLLARDRDLGRLVALKVLATDCERLLGRLRSEARLLARLEHPAIVRVHALDVWDGRLFLAMEYAAGGSLAGLRLPPRALVRTLRGVVDALALAHARGVVHRDVKPENVLVLRPDAAAPRGRAPAVLADFGLAAGPDEGSEALRRPIVGTPVTMSPEQIDGGPVGPASDVFSLGVTLYRALSGRWPFPGRTVPDVFEAIRERAPLPLGAGAAPRALDAIVRKALDKDPARRFSSMAELGRALDRFLAGRALLAPFTGWIRRDDERVSRIGIHPEDVS